jgi:8-oxo-dGTP pyrophosphatase MutT (NUDIX family)
MKKQIMYHSTDKKNKKNILENGLMVNNSGGFTIGGSWAHEVYGGNPIFLSDEKERYSEEDSVTFAVDVTGLNLLADLPTLIDFGANLEEDYTMWWSDGESPRNFEMFLDDGAISAYDIIGSDDFNKAAIKVTRTAAVMENIPAQRISLLEDIKNDRLARLIKNIRKNSSTYYGKAGAGILFVCKEDQTCLLLKRSNRVEEGGTWGISGGAVSKGEGFYNKNDIQENETLDFKETAFRESNEELFSDGSFNVDLIDKEFMGQTEFKDGGFKYLTFVYNVSLETKKKITSKISLDWENDAAKWFNMSSLPSNLHFGVDFTRKSLIEQEIDLFRSTYDEFDWLYEELIKIKDNSKALVWKDIFEKFYLLPRKTPGINLYDFKKEQNKKTYEFILESS